MAYTIRMRNMGDDATFASLTGFGIEGYRLAIAGLAAKIGAKAKA